MTFTDYTTSTGNNTAIAGSSASEGKNYWDLGKLKRCFTDFLGNKQAELEEQRIARRYYHASQWTPEQIEELKRRKQPPTVFNRTARKIDGAVGLLERLRQDPKAFPRTPKHEEGADLATAVVRYVLDEQRWKEKSPEVARDGAIDGIGGIEILIERGDQGDPEVGFDIVEPDSFVYDPRSFKPDFSDAAYMGIAKWMDKDILQEMFPDKADEIDAADYQVGELSTDSDRQRRWFSDHVKPRIRVVDLWYRQRGEWHWCLFTGAMKLMEGKSYLTDEKKKTFCKYIMFSGNVDQDGDRYGFIRNLKSAQDAINARQSKMQHILASKRLLIRQGSVKDIEQVRKEWSRPDGVIQVPGDINTSVKADDQSFDFAGWTKMMEMAVSEIENYGPNPAVLGQGLENSSGKAIQLLQQAGIAELGPYILAFRGWKLRVYRAIWNAVRTHWTAERFIRITDDDGLAQFIAVNQLGVDPNTGLPAIINQLGALDVDIILDEGPDTITIAQETHETVSQVLQNAAPVLSPVEVRTLTQILLDTSGLPSASKKMFKDAAAKAEQMAANQGPPPEIQIKQAEMAMKQQADQASLAITAQKNQQEADAKIQMAMLDARIEEEANARKARFEEQQAARELNLKRELGLLDVETDRMKIMVQAEAAEKREPADA